MEPLFVEPSLTFEKVAAEVALPEDPNSWPHEILQELFKQAPYVSEFDPHINMQQVDAERGYGFGFIEVSNKTEMQPDEASPDAMQAAGVKQVRIPVIIQDCNLYALDVLISDEGKVMPLTETRLRQSLFRPQSFDVTSKTPGDQSLIGQLYPPFRQNYGGGGGVNQSAGMGKEGSVLEAILPTANPGDYNRFFEQLEDKEVQAAFLDNASATASALNQLASYEPISLQKRAAVLPHLIKASVAQVVKDVEGYRIKTANHNFWEPVDTAADRGEVVRRFGAKVALAADMNGSVTVAEDGKPEEAAAGAAPPAAAEVPPAEQAELIKDFGIYKVCDDQGRQLVGYVFPNLLDLDGTPLPLALFTNGSQSALQGEISGVRVGDAVPVHEGDLQGKGCFFTMGDSEAHATIPLEIHAALTDEGGAGYMASTLDGRQVRVSVQPVEQMTLMDDELLIPGEYRWMTLEGAEEVVLCSSPDDVGKEASLMDIDNVVFINGAGTNEFHLQGTPVEKVAAAYLSFDDALFLLGGLGVNLHHAINKLAEASHWSRPVPVRVARHIKTASEQMQDAAERGAAWVASMPDLQRSLIKEAAVIPDPVAVDTVLSLGFLNPQNTNAFIGSLPQLEEGQQRICELLIASRLGLKDVPAPALENAMHATEEVLEGLRILAFQKN